MNRLTRRNLRRFNGVSIAGFSKGLAMIQIQLKLKLSRAQEALLDQWLWHLTAVWNWAIRKIEQDAKDGIYFPSDEA